MIKTKAKGTERVQILFSNLPKGYKNLLEFELELMDEDSYEQENPELGEIEPYVEMHWGYANVSGN